MDLWYPPAVRMPFQGSGSPVGGPWRGVLHTTEGSSAEGAFGAYRTRGDLPQFTAAWAGAFEIWQHMPLNVMATALVHAPGTIDTNRLSAVQIEIVGFANASPQFPQPLLDGLRAWMMWVEAQTGIQPTAPLFKPYPASGGVNNGVRMSPAAWAAFNGWCGHMHVPSGNDHGDPGAINMAFLLQRSAPTPTTGVRPMYDPPIGPFAAAWVDADGKVISAITPHGEVYWGKWWGNVAGKPYWGNRTAAAIGARDDGQPGYMITATDGAKYRLPDGLDHL